VFREIQQGNHQLGKKTTKKTPRNDQGSTKKSPRNHQGMTKEPPVKEAPRGDQRSTKETPGNHQGMTKEKRTTDAQKKTAKEPPQGYQGPKDKAQKHKGSHQGSSPTGELQLC
jgi:hypothetical protein